MINEDINNTNDYELIMLYRENDENAKNILFIKYKFIIDILINKYNKYFLKLNIDFQEIYSECNVGFSNALRSYREDKDSSLATFITLCVERKIINLVKKYNREKYKILHETYSLDFIYEDSNVNLLNILSDNESDPLKNLAEEEEYIELLRVIKENLSKKEYEVFVLMARGLNYIEIAGILNKTSKQIDNTMQRIKKKIKNFYKSENLT